MKTGNLTHRTIAVIGGGVSGALTAFHLDREGADADIVVIDPRPEIGLGLAYSTPSLRHLLNVPAGKISALPSHPDHFLHWLRANFDRSATAATFAPRAIFGRYIRSLFAEARTVRQMQSSVEKLELHGAGAMLTLEDGRTLYADYVVVATGNFDPAPLPGVEPEAIASGAYVHNAWLPGSLENLDADAAVTLVGTGLTAVDVLLRLRELGHRGPIVAASRHGVFPNRHSTYAPADRVAIPKTTAATCVAYLRALRAAIAGGMEWRAAIDSLRGTSNDLWLALPHKEQLRFRRHLQRRWDVVRHRMAPHIADVIEAELAAGTLAVREGHLAGVSATKHGAKVILSTAEGTASFETARVINCTGPSMNYRRVQSALLQSLFGQGIVSAGPLGGGFRTTRSGAMIDANGRVSEILFNLGPGRLGTLLESIAVPEIREQAVEIAAILSDRIEAANEREAGDTAHDVERALAFHAAEPTAARVSA